MYSLLLYKQIICHRTVVGNRKGTWEVLRLLKSLSSTPKNE